MRVSSTTEAPRDTAPTRSPSACSRASRSPTTSTACCRRSSTPARPRPPCARSRSPTPAGAGTCSPASASATSSTTSAPGWPPRRSSAARRSSARACCAGRSRTTSSAPGFVEGTVLAAYEYRAYKTPATTTPRLDELVVSAHHDTSAEVERAAIVAEAANAARDLQNAPGQRHDADGAGRARPRAARRAGRGLGPRRDRGGGHGRVRRRRARQPRGAEADHDPLRARRTSPARCSASSARA